MALMVARAKDNDTQIRLNTYAYKRKNGVHKYSLLSFAYASIHNENTEI